MSGQSPAVVLYSSDGTELSVVSGSAIPAGTRALLVSGNDPSGNARYTPTAASGALGIAEMANNFAVQTAATVTASGSAIVNNNHFGTQEIAIIVNVGTVTGAGTIQYTIQELDPGDGVTVYGNSATTSVISTGNAPGVFTAILNVTTSPSVKVTWTVTGTFSATIYSTIITKTSPATQTINGTVTATNNSVGSDGATALTFDTQVGGITTTNPPTYTTGNLDALSLTTKGGLRIDGVFPTGAAVPISNAMYMGGAVTTAAPAYTTGQINPLSLTTVGGLRIDGVYVTGTATGTAVDAIVSGGYVTTAAPTYATAQLNALSLTTGGQLRIDSVYPTGTVTANAPDATEMGAITVAGPPTYTTGQLNALTTDVGGNLRVITNKASVASVTSVAVTATTATSLLASNTSRVFASLYNNGTKGTMYVLLGGGTASAANFSITLLPASYWEVPVDWTGAVSCFATNASTVLCTELTP